MRKSIAALSFVFGLTLAGGAFAQAPAAQTAPAQVTQAAPKIAATPVLAVIPAGKPAGKSAASEAERKAAHAKFAAAAKLRAEAKTSEEAEAKFRAEATNKDKEEQNILARVNGLVAEANKLNADAMRETLVITLRNQSVNLLKEAENYKTTAKKYAEEAVADDARAQTQEETAAKLSQDPKADAQMKAIAENLKKLAAGDRADAVNYRKASADMTKKAEDATKMSASKKTLAEIFAKGVVSFGNAAQEKAAAAAKMAEANKLREEAKKAAAAEAIALKNADAADKVQNAKLAEAAKLVAEGVKLWVEGQKDEMAWQLRHDAAKLVWAARLNELRAGLYRARSANELSRAKSQEEAAAKLATGNSDAAMKQAAESLKKLAAQDRREGESLSKSAEGLLKSARDQRAAAAAKVAQAKRLDPNGK